MSWDKCAGVCFILAFCWDAQVVAQPAVAEQPVERSLVESQTLAAIFQGAADAAVSQGFFLKPGQFSGAHPQSLDVMVCSGNRYLILVAAIPPMGAPPVIRGASSGEIQPASVETQGPIVRIFIDATRTERIRMVLPGPTDDQASSERSLLVAVLYK